MADDLDGVIEQTGMGRRTFMRRLVTGTVFAVPVVASFAMGGIDAAAASAHTPCINPNQTILRPVINPNQTQNQNHDCDHDGDFGGWGRGICNPNQTKVAQV
jgi:hypothetical protein